LDAGGVKNRMLSEHEVRVCILFSRQIRNGSPGSVALIFFRFLFSIKRKKEGKVLEAQLP
ncbi:hypothetical protein LJC52_02010, partial [Bacteroidales bacterium OttesenSCG-928-A17]|nr:hypothetical protein [Bacteroidales bacterium OttesenSCG-928-A17]